MHNLLDAQSKFFKHVNGFVAHCMSPPLSALMGHYSCILPTIDALFGWNETMAIGNWPSPSPNHGNNWSNISFMSRTCSYINRGCCSHWNTPITRCPRTKGTFPPNGRKGLLSNVHCHHATALSPSWQSAPSPSH